MLLLSWNNPSLCVEWDTCRTDLEQTSRNTITKTVKCYHSENADFMSFGGTVHWTGKLEGRSKKEILWKRLTSVLILFILASTFLPKQQPLAINIPKKHREIAFTVKSLSPHDPLPSYFLEWIHNISSPVIILKYFYHCDWMAELFPEKSLMFTYFTRWNLRAPFSFCQFQKCRSNNREQFSWQ